MNQIFLKTKYMIDIFWIFMSLIGAYVFSDYINLGTSAVIVFPIAMGFYYLQKWGGIKREELSRDDIWYIIFSFIIAIMLILCKHIVPDFGNYSSSSEDVYILKYTIYDFAALFILTYEIIILSKGIVRLIDYISDLQLERGKRNVGEIQSITVKNVLIVAGILFLCWVPYFLLYYPGIIYGDSTASISQALGKAPYSNHYPLIYTLFIKECIKIGAYLVGNTMGCAIYTVIQMVYISIIFAYGICWLRNKGMTKYYCVLMVFFFALPRFWGQHAISMWKDPIFSVTIYFYSLKLFDIIYTKGEVFKSKSYILQCVLALLIICFSRNNGIYVVAFSLIFIIICAFKYLKKGKVFIVATILSMVFVWFIQGPVYKTVGVMVDPVESYGIPLQQVARTVVYNGKISQSEKEFIEKIIPVDKFKENYSPELVDTLKWSAEFNSNRVFFDGHQKEFVKTWISLFVKNPGIYFEAWELNSCGFWGLSFWQLNNYKENIIMGVPHTDELKKLFAIETKSLIPSGLAKKMQSYFSLETPMPSVALCFWIMLFMVMVLLVKKKKNYILALIPCIGNMGTLFVATPISYWPRYALASLCMLPISLVIPYIVRNENQSY